MPLKVLLATWALALAAQDFDLLLIGGRVLDGSANPWFRADLGIRGDRIAAIGNLRQRSSRAKRDLRDAVVAPGFIDMMGGSSLPLLLDPGSGQSKLRQGITTMMAGEGVSVAPQNEATLPAEARAKGYRWRTLAEYHQILEKRGLPLNVVHNVGAAQVRRVVLGDQDVAPTPAQLEQMKQLVEEAMQAGAVGLSTALIYPPGAYATESEIVELAKVAARYGGFYATHMRNESGRLLEAVHEAIAIGEKAGLPVHIYHLKAAGQANWGLMRQAIEAIEQARRRGLDITADIYPYIRNGLGLGAFIAPRHYVRGTQPLLRALDDAAFRASLRREIESDAGWENWYQHVGRNWDNVLVAQLPGSEDQPLAGKSIAEIARLWGKSEWDTFFELVRRRAVVNPKSMDEEQKRLALRTPWISLCTDAPPINPQEASGAHPRAFGSFPRVLARYVRQEGVISLEAAVRKMTSLAANRLGLFDRGRIAVGMAADLVVFDPERVQDTATDAQPLSYPEGIALVIVNGQIVVEEGRWTQTAAGRLLRPLRP